MDCLNFLAPVWGKKLEGPLLDNMPWPPKIMKDIFLWWTNICDPVLGYNPSWYAVICGYSPFFHSLFYLAAIWALWNGKSKVPIVIPVLKKKIATVPLNMWATFWSGWMISGVIPVFAESLGVSGAVYPSPNKLLFLAGYHSFILFPLLTLYRFSGETSENCYHRYQGKNAAAAAPAPPASDATSEAVVAAAKGTPSRGRSASAKARNPRSSSKGAKKQA